MCIVYTNYGCGGHLDGVTPTIYAQPLCLHAQENELNWLSGFEDFLYVHVQFLISYFCFKCIPSCNSPVEIKVS